MHRELGKLPLLCPKVDILLYKVALYDYDGAYNAVKPLLDGLKIHGGAGVIVDDSPKDIRLEVIQIPVKHRKDERVEIKLTF